MKAIEIGGIGWDDPSNKLPGVNILIHFEAEGGRLLDFHTGYHEIIDWKTACILLTKGECKICN